MTLPIGEIIKEYEAGMSTPKLAVKYGVHASTLNALLKKNGVKIRSCRKNLPVEDIISNYQAGMSTHQLGDKYGVSYQTINVRLGENGIPLRRKGPNTTKSFERTKKVLPVEEVISEYLLGFTSGDLAKKYGCTSYKIIHLLKENDIKVRGVKKELPMDDVIKGYESGMTTYELGEWYGVSYTTILNRLKEHGVQVRKKGVGGMDEGKKKEHYNRLKIINSKK